MRESGSHNGLCGTHAPNPQSLNREATVKNLYVIHPHKPETIMHHIFAEPLGSTHSALWIDRIPPHYH